METTANGQERGNGKGTKWPTGLPGSSWHKGKIKFTQSTLLQVIQTSSCKQSKVTTTERKATDRNLPQTTPEGMSSDIPEMLGFINEGHSCFLPPVKWNNWNKDFFLLFFPFFSPLPKELTNPALFFFSGHFSVFVSVHRTQHIAVTHMIWSHCFSNENQNREGEPSRKLKQIPPRPPKTIPKNQTHLSFSFSRPQKWANQNQKIKTEITHRRNQERD